MFKSSSTSFRKLISNGVGVSLLMGMGFHSSVAMAGDVDPAAYTAHPPGTTLALVYNVYSDRDKRQVPGVGMIDRGMKIRSDTGIFRLVYFAKIGKIVHAPDIIIPYGKFYDIHLNGNKQRNSKGLGDIIAFDQFWLINKPDPAKARYFAISTIFIVPTGNYNHNKPVNIGSNRMVYDLQAGLIQGLGKPFKIDMIGDLIWYGHNKKFGPAKRTLSQKMTGTIQFWFRYAPEPKTTFALGYAEYWGGRQHVDGVYNNSRTRNRQIRFSYSYQITPTFQMQTGISRMIHVRGGFREKFRGQIRFMKTFRPPSRK